MIIPRSALIMVLALSGTALLGQSLATPVPISRADYGIKSGMLRKVVVRDGAVYAVDEEHHTVYVVRDGHPRNVGSIGNGPGDLYQPSDLAVDARQWLYVQDSGNRRIAMYNERGQFAGAFPISVKSLGIGVNRRHEVLLGQPQLGNLVTVYDTRGRRLRGFGALIKPSSIYGAAYQRFDRNEAWFNRVRIAVDNDDNVWVAFAYMPLLLKFAPDGRLILRKELRYPEMKPVLDSVGSNKPNYDFAAMNLDGIQLTMVVRDLAWDDRRQTVIVLLGNERTIVLAGNGRELTGFRPAEDHGNLQSVATVGDEFLATIYGSPYIYRMEPRKIR